MGQAFDGDGRVLGEAFGETKREVLEKLEEAHPDAEEIRIRTVRAREDIERATATASTPMPQYQCHKKVWALKIKEVVFDHVLAQATNRETDGTAMIMPADAGYALVKVSRDYVNKHLRGVDPDGGYYVVYEDGYASFSPAKAFEEGYTRI